MAKTNGGDMSLANFNGSQIADIQATVDLSELMEKIKQIKALKVALDACHRFRENAIRYAQLEAAALIRVVELGGANKLKGHQRGAAKWLYELSDEARNRAINTCAEGLTIEQVWKRDVYDEQKTQEAIVHLLDMRAELVSDVKECGIVDMKSFVQSVPMSFPPQLKQDLIDGTRKALRSAGAVGVGDNSGTYLMPSPERQDDVKEAILSRFESVMRDLASIKKIAKTTKIQLDYKEFGVEIVNAERSGDGYLIHVLIGLQRMGAIENGDEMMEEIARADAYEECAYVQRAIGCSKVKAAELLLENVRKNAEKESA